MEGTHQSDATRLTRSKSLKATIPTHAVWYDRSDGSVEINDAFAVWYDWSEESVEMNDRFAVAYDCSDEPVEKNDVFEALYDCSDESVEKNHVFAVLGVSSCGSVRGVCAGLDFSSGRSVNRSKVLDVFTLLEYSSGKFVKRHLAALAVLEDSSGESIDSSIDSSDESVEEDNSD